MRLSRDLAKAREAFRRADREASAAAHDGPPSGEESHQDGAGQYIKSAVYGGLDGIVTTFAVVAGVAGAQLRPGIVLILGLANVVADGLSMAVGDYLSTKSEQEYHRAERRREEWEVEHYPEGEQREMIELYVAKGISEEDARTVVDIFARHKKAWVDIMMVEELGILGNDESPLANAVVTFLSFAVFGLVPLLAYVLVQLMPALPIPTFATASVATGVTLFALGAAKVRITGRHWLVSGLEMLLVGGLAATAAYGIGVLLGGLA
ncbi:MAG: VIT1/CCC1 transporter family protein [Thermoguttaceae bacterium]|jgi:VIT1/CCC1 family predicted Fe2+/Mn2+ transporter|nr:VIT1/CCC1 transporter family protein [Thermoguttaceae bacterium]